MKRRNYLADLKQWLVPAWRFWLKSLQKKMREPENGCGTCAVCHRVCQLLEQNKNKKNQAD